MKNENKLKYEKYIMNISLIGSVLFMIAEGVMAFWTRSHSILMDCIFDLTDLIMIGPFLLLVPLLYNRAQAIRFCPGGVIVCRY